MRCFCPHCSQLVVQDRNPDGVNFCPHCCKLFEGVAEKMPFWIWGLAAVVAVVLLMAVWQIMCHPHGA